MRKQNTPKKMMTPETRSLTPFVDCFKSLSSGHGYTLLEVLAVVTIMALAAAVMAPVITDSSDQVLTNRTMESMEAVRTAVLGTPSDRVRGDVRFAGYVPDMGTLPALHDVLGTPEDTSDDQPSGLWTDDPQGTPGDETDDLIARRPYGFFAKWDSSTSPHPKSIIRMGWRGPYIKPPTGEALEDGWKNPLRFQIAGRDLVITSLGADNKAGGKDYDQDMTLTIKSRDWSGDIQGYVSPMILEEYADNGQVDLRIYYAPGPDCEAVENYWQVKNIEICRVRGSCKYERITLDTDGDGFFRFENIPQGTQRLLLVGDDSEGGDYGYKIGIGPGVMWLGTPATLLF